MPSRPESDRVRWTYEFIKAHRTQFPVEVMCRELGVAPSGCYQWLECPPPERAVEDARRVRSIRASFTASQVHSSSSVAPSAACSPLAPPAGSGW